MTDRASKLVNTIRGILTRPPYSFHSSFDAITKTDEYRELVSIGDPALAILCGCLSNGDLFLSRAIMEISGLHLEDLGLGQFPSEQDIAEAILGVIATQVVWTAESYMPRVRPTIEIVPSANNTVSNSSSFVMGTTDSLKFIANKTTSTESRA